MKNRFTYILIGVAALIIVAISGAFAASTTVNVERTTTVKVVKQPPPSNPGYYVCYNRLYRYVTRNFRIERCNPYGACRVIMIPRQFKVTRYTNCQINQTRCRGSLSRFGWYPSPAQAQAGLNACRNQPVVIRRINY